MNILNKLTIKHMMMNKKRTIVTIIGVILSTALMVGIGLLFSSVRDNSVKMVIEEEGSHHAVILDVATNQLPIVEKNVKVKHIDYAKTIGHSLLKEESYKQFIEVNAVNHELLETIPLIEGRLPENDQEILIPNHLLRITDNDQYKVGNTIELNLGTIILLDELLEDHRPIYQLEDIETKTYTIVGIMEKNHLTSTYAEESFECVTIDQNSEAKTMNIYLTYKKAKDTYAITDTLLKNIGVDTKPVYNSALLSLSGVSQYDNMINAMMRVIIIVLSLVSIGCIIVIYNSFAISVMERKKQFGLFSSIGTTKIQLKKTVFFEALLVGIVGIPLGILGAFLGISIVITIINHLLPEAFAVPLALSVYPLFIGIPIIFMIVVILVSAYLPARSASKITPIEAIRQNDDIKIKSKKIRTRKWIRKLFGIEGELAFKNMKRNKRKYRITIVSLFISIVLFISFSGILYYGISTSMDYTGLPDYDIAVFLSETNETPAFIEQLRSQEQIDEYIITQASNYVTKGLTVNNYEKKFLKQTDLKIEPENLISLDLIGINRESYNQFKKQIGLTEDQPIVINYTKGVYYSANTREAIQMRKYTSLPNELPLCLYNYKNTTEDEEQPAYMCNGAIKDFFMTESYPMGFELYINGSYEDRIVIVVPEELYLKYDNISLKEEVGLAQSANKTILIKAKKYDKLEKFLKTALDEEKGGLYSYINVVEEMKLLRNMVFVIKMLLYGFITLVTLIGVTSVFNTIHTSINLRRKEFAMLRSMGLTPKGFNKILYFESIFFGLKSLLYGIPVSLGIVYLLCKAFDGMAEQKFVIPWDSIGVAVIGVFIIVFITMWYASRKLKKENILDAIREENI